MAITLEITSDMMNAGVNLFAFYFGVELLFPKKPPTNPNYNYIHNTMMIFQSGIYSFVTVTMASAISKIPGEPVMGDYLLAIFPVLFIDHMMYLHKMF
jgi:hypothetical protein